MRFLRLIGSAFFDLVIRWLPQIKPRKGFAFLVHPRNHKDVVQKYPFLKPLSPRLLDFLLAHFWPVTVSRVTGAMKKDNSRLPGWVISIPLTADQMMYDRERAKKHIAKAAHLAERKGANMIGLGALNASLTRGGLDLLPRIKAHVTTGRLYTSKVVTDTADKARRELSIPLEDTIVAIVGAAGSIGAASAQLLQRKGYKNFIFVDIEKKNEQLEDLKILLENLGNGEQDIEITHDIERIYRADIVIAVTNRPETLIKSEHLKSGAVVVDDAQPSDVDSQILEERDDVLILEGGVAHHDEIDAHFNFGLKHKTDMFSCLAEAIILAAIEYQDNFQVGSVFEVDFNEFAKLEEEADELGFSLGEFQNFVKVYSSEDIDRVKAHT